MATKTAARRPAPPKTAAPKPTSPKKTAVKAAVLAEDVDEELVAASIPDTTGTYWVTPELAALWLTRNTNNRNLREQRVTTMARDMGRDEWAYTGEAIKFTTTGRLVDGQHRLWAVVRSGATVKMLVVLGVPEEAQAYMDAGVMRTAGDALAFRGETNSKNLAAAVRLGMAVEHKNLRHSSISHADILDWLADNPEIRRYVQLVTKYRSKIDMKPAVMSYGLFRLSRINEDEANAFFASIVEMRTNGKGDPIYTFLQRFATARRTRERTTPETELSWLYKTWNSLRQRQQLHQLKIPFANEETVPR